MAFLLNPLSLTTHQHRPSLTHRITTPKTSLFAFTVITLLIAKLMYTCPWVLDASGDFERLYPPAPELVQLLEGCRKPGSIEARALFDGIAVAAWGFESASACASASSAQCAAHSPRPTSFVVMLERWSLGQLHNFRARDTRTATTTSLQEMAALLVTTLKEG